MKDNELRTVSDADYRHLMTEAYPSPKKDIRAAVMAQITAEAAQSGKKAKILTPAFRKRFVRYGSIAACFVLLVTLGFRVLPMMTKDAVMESAVNTSAPQAADMDGSYAEEAVPETQAASAGGSGILKSKLTGSAPSAPAGEPAEEEPAEEEIMEEPAAVTAYSAALTDTVTEDVIVEEALPEAEEAPSPDPVPMLMMAPAPVAEEAAEEELCDDAAAVTEECVEECVVEVVEEECVVEECVVEEAPAEEIAAPEYYRYGNAPDEAEAVRRSFEYELKLDLSDEVYDSYGNWMTDHGYTDVSHWSLAEFVYDFALARERFAELYDTLTGTFAQLHPGYVLPSYDLDKMYGMDTDITESIAAGNPGYVTDALYRN